MLATASEIADGLAYLHGQGMIHGDLSSGAAWPTSRLLPKPCGESYVELRHCCPLTCCSLSSNGASYRCCSHPDGNKDAVLRLVLICASIAWTQPVVQRLCCAAQATCC